MPTVAACYEVLQDLMRTLATEEKEDGSGREAAQAGHGAATAQKH